MEKEKQLKKIKEMLLNQEEKLRLDKEALNDAMNKVVEREAKILIFQKTIHKMTPHHPYFKNNIFHCNFCHKKVEENTVFCPYCLQNFTWDNEVEPIISHLDELDPIKETDKIINESKERHTNYEM